MSKHSSSSSTRLPPAGWGYYGGWFFFILSLILPFLSPLVPLLGLNNAITTILIGSFVVGGPELIMVLAIALWGKATFDYFMGKIYQLLKGLAPADTVSPVRYYIGLALLISSFFPSWIIAYVPTLVSQTMRFYIVVPFDILFVISFFILGGDFWEKVRALFVHAPIKIMQKKLG